MIDALSPFGQHVAFMMVLTLFVFSIFLDEPEQ